MGGQKSYVLSLRCVACGREQRPDAGMTCPACGVDEGICDVRYDMDAVRLAMTASRLAERERAIWRYEELLPTGCVGQANRDVGWTPLIEAPRLAEELGIARLRLKDEGQSPSGSFKDRASAVGVALALGGGFREVACASTGNAATSLARCSANAGIGANIFVGREIPEGKLAQLLAYGARVFCVAGSYAQAYDLCMSACDRFGWYNRNCAVNPYLVEGKKTGGLEVAEQCADDPPDWVSVSVGDGCTIAGIAKGIAQMREVGIIDWSCRVLGVQAAGVSPIAEAAKTDRLNRDGGGNTYADSINVPVPRNWRKAVHAVRDSDGCFVTVSDGQIRQAVATTGRLSGVFAEPAAAAAVAGIAQARRQGIVSERSSVVAMITGTGLKDIPGALSALHEPHRIESTLDAVERIVTADDQHTTPKKREA